MKYIREISKDLYYIGVDDNKTRLFENYLPLETGVSYNSYLLMDEKTVLFDTVDWSVCRQFLENIEYALQGRDLDYLIVHHIEPDHSACIEEIVLRYPNVVILTTDKAATFMTQFGLKVSDKTQIVGDGDEQSFGKHKFKFLKAPMVHWPEVMVSYDQTSQTLFSADAFGSFGTLKARVLDTDKKMDEQKIEDFRRYYSNIVGKYGANVQALFKKLSGLKIDMICPLHGIVLKENINMFLEKYDKWSKCEPEEKGVLIVYASMYGNTENAAYVLANKFIEKGFTNFSMNDVSNTHVSKLVSKTFKYSHIVLASPTYNLGTYPLMQTYLHDIKELNVSGRTVSFLENGTWALKAGSIMREHIEGMKNMTILEDTIVVKSTVNMQNEQSLENLAQAIINDINK